MSNANNRRGGIVRVNKRANSYTVLDTFFLTDERLSWKAKGLLGYLLSKPDNWRVYVTDLVKRAKDGRDSVYSGIRELEENGYIERHQIRDEKGRISHMETVVYERPLVNGDMPPNPPDIVSDAPAISMSDKLRAQSDRGLPEINNSDELVDEPSNEQIQTNEPARSNPLTENPLAEKPTLDTATLSIIDLSNIDLKVIDRLSARENIKNIDNPKNIKKESKQKHGISMSKIPDTKPNKRPCTPILLKTLAECLREIPVNDTVTLYDFYFDEIYAALCRHFGDLLEPEIIRRAGDVYRSRTIDDRTLKPKLTVYNPTGLFIESYRDALNVMEAFRWRAAGG